MTDTNKTGSNGGPDEMNLVSNRFLRGVLIVVGCISLGLGLIGIFLPLLPTTPFLLLAAACFARSSERFYRLIMNNKRFGPYIKNYREGKGLPFKLKALAVTFLWASILTSMYFFLENIYLHLILLIIAVVVSVHILRIPTMK